VRELRYRLSGSPDIYGPDGRSACSSVNFVTSHDGFTLNDLVSYSHKHNEANLEENRDGLNENNSWNCGADGPSDDPYITGLRKRLCKNYLCCLFFSSGIPMMLGGDEFLRSQLGNNNAYCQDNEISWFDWSLTEANADMLRFCRKLITLVKRYDMLRIKGRFSDGVPSEHKNYVYEWLSPELSPPDWDDAENRTLALRIFPRSPKAPGPEFFLILNSDHVTHSVTLPEPPGGKRWRRSIDTSLEGSDDIADEGEEIVIDPPEHYISNPRSTVLLIGRGACAIERISIACGRRVYRSGSLCSGAINSRLRRDGGHKRPHSRKEREFRAGADHHRSAMIRYFIDRNYFS
jgi:glycogen operon protein